MRSITFKRGFAAPVVMALVLALSMLFVCPATAADSPAPGPKESAAPRTIAEAFVGEELVYSISFWIFNDIAVGRVRLDSDGEGGYVASLVAETTGVVGWILSYRKDTYLSRMRMSSDGQRFISQRFEKVVDKSGKVRSGVTTIDHEAHRASWVSWGAGKGMSDGTANFPEGIYIDDALAAFYNYRYGAYGALEVGKEVRIPTIPKNDEKVPEIELRITDDRERVRRMPDGVDGVDYLADVVIDKELFGQKDGEIDVYFTAAMVPKVAVALDVAMFGDLTGKLIDSNIDLGVSKPVPPPLVAPSPEEYAKELEADRAREKALELLPDVGY